MTPGSCGRWIRAPSACRLRRKTAGRATQWVGGGLLQTSRLEAVAATGGCPLFFGVGLLARAPAVFLQTPGDSSGRGLPAASRSVRGGTRAGRDPDPSLSPEATAQGFSIGLAGRIGRGVRLLASEEHDGSPVGSESHCIGVRRDGAEWSEGGLLRSAQRGPGAAGIWVARRRPGEETSLEIARLTPCLGQAGVRWSRFLTGDRGRRLWWDLVVRQALLPLDRLDDGDPPGAPARTLSYRGAELGASSGRQSAGAQVLWERRAACLDPASGDPTTPRLREAEVRHLRLSGQGFVTAGIAWTFRADARDRTAVTVGLPDAPFESGLSTSTSRIRARATLESTAGGGLLVGLPSGYGLELGEEALRSSSSGGSDAAVPALWAGAWHKCAILRRIDGAFGFVVIQLPGSRSLSLSPFWIGGSRFPVRAGGFWSAVRVSGRLGPLAWWLRGFVPIRPEGSRSTGSARRNPGGGFEASVHFESGAA